MVADTQKKNTGESERSNINKVADLLIALGSEYAAKIFKYLDDETIDAITVELASQKKVSANYKAEAVREFSQIAMAHDYISTGGLAYAQNILEQALGKAKAKEVIKRLTSNLQVRPFDFLNRTDPVQLVNFLKNEHPQTVALIIAYMEPEQAANVLIELETDLQVDIVRRVATMERTSPDVIENLERHLESKLSSIMMQRSSNVGGVRSIVEVINRLDNSAEKAILDVLAKDDPELTDAIKLFMFVFDDIVKLDDRSMQLVLRQVDKKDLALALKTATTDITDKIFQNISENAANMLREELKYMGPVRVRDVEAAQQAIVKIIRDLEEKGIIIIPYGKGDELIV